MLRISHESANLIINIRMFPGITETCGGEWYMRSLLFSMLKWKAGLQANESSCSPILCSYINSFWIAFTAPILKPLNLHTSAFKYYQKKCCILHIAFTSSVASSNKCSEFHFISLFIFLSKHKALYKQNFLENTFPVKI